MTYIGLVSELRNMTTTLFQMLHIEPYYFCLSKVDEIRLPFCRTTTVKECDELISFMDEVGAFR